MAADDQGSRRPTIQDVATASGVSIATVSRALRSKGRVSKKTRERVQQAAKELGYRPNVAASSLRLGYSTAVAVVVSYLNSWYIATVLAAAESVLTAAGLEIRIFVVDSAESRQRFLNTVMPRSIGGVIVVDLAAGELDLDRVFDPGTPRVVLGSTADGASSISIDNELVGAMATRHLLDLGHRRIGVISGFAGPDVAHVSPVDARLRGYRSAHDELGLTTDPDLEVGGGYSIVGGLEAATSLLRRTDRPTALFAMSDEMAIGALRAARDVGVSVPEKLSVVGVDDHPMAWVCDLTTIAYAAADHGRLAASLIVDRIDSPEPPTTELRPSVELIVRGTTAVADNR